VARNLELGAYLRRGVVLEGNPALQAAYLGTA
jgi:hypothetical protein